MTQRPKKLKPQPGGPDTPLGKMQRSLMEELRASGLTAKKRKRRRDPSEITVTFMPRRAADAQIPQGPAPTRNGDKT